ncbi:hypothetical protein BDM02DRAFT_3120278 [Thelephora ganbajun]|uniref:Uncharacterized protein n=1 Tax=Thelephora ganbajun TaxID=370292 RepID=A0ACB6Z6W4_THEGA|nr:hypothetical protein BDM02DRAFT_3120278 [Thelephora ganbajun]
MLRLKHSFLFPSLLGTPGSAGAAFHDKIQREADGYGHSFMEKHGEGLNIFVGTVFQAEDGLTQQNK